VAAPSKMSAGDASNECLLCAEAYRVTEKERNVVFWEETIQRCIHTMCVVAVGRQIFEIIQYMQDVDAQCVQTIPFPDWRKSTIQPVTEADFEAESRRIRAKDIVENYHSWYPKYGVVLFVYFKGWVCHRFLIAQRRESIVRFLSEGTMKQARRWIEEPITIRVLWSEIRSSTQKVDPVLIDRIHLPRDFEESLSEKKKEILRIFKGIYGLEREKSIAFLNQQVRCHVLLSGMPGSGKSYFASVIAATIGSSTILKLDFKGTNWKCDLECSANRTVVVIDDVDTIFTSRAEDPNSKVHSHLGDLLTLLDSYSDKQIVFLLTTNHENKLDPAVYRSERITVRAEFGWAEESELRYIIRGFFPDDVDTVMKVIQKIPCTHGMITGICRKAKALGRLPDGRDIASIREESQRLQNIYYRCNRSTMYH